MHLKSSHRVAGSPQQQEDVPIIIFKRGEKRKFLKRPDTYEDMVRVVRRKFDIEEGETPVFGTRSLEVCNDQNIEIDEEVYVLMASYLDEIEVSVPEHMNFGDNRAVMDDDVPPFVEPLVGTSRSVVVPENNFTDEFQEPDVSMEEADTIGTGGASNSKGKKVVTNKGKEKARDEFVDTDTDSAPVVGKRSNTKGRAGINNAGLDDVHTKPTSKTKSDKPKSRGRPPKEKESAKGKKEQKSLADSFEKEEVNTPPKPNKPASRTKAKVKANVVLPDSDGEDNAPATANSSMRRRTASLRLSRIDDEFDNIAANDETENPSPLQDHQMNVEEDADDDGQRYHDHTRDDPAGLFDDEIAEIERVPRLEDEGEHARSALEEMEVDEQLAELPASPRFEDSDGKWEHVKVKKEAIGVFNEHDRSRAPAAGPSTSPGRSGRERVGTNSVAPPSPVKTSSSKNNKNKAGPSTGPPRSQTLVGTDQGQDVAENGMTEDGRFKVFIEGPGGELNKAEFMTRMRHPVKKVLQGACRHFGVDPKRAQLELLVEDVEDDGSTVTHSFRCEKDETMGQAGVKPLANLRVVVPEEDEDGF
ncbi:hypothetical protein K435DRAFT_781112 [Dendrothele bispora CBS 962.96]|uniref:Uncharacterized protein n=1 Tax=Dendrothele bispora (strain CBS 962.96) TaxID=1314807 RepID=A0A4S8LPC7_DENBC|nr:hypothetical protein K435DRAFT_781112 [Dendrothele bispora CBS 962.96]